MIFGAGAARRELYSICITSTEQRKGKTSSRSTVLRQAAEGFEQVRSPVSPNGPGIVRLKST
jgi:hypothetical protein